MLAVNGTGVVVEDDTGIGVGVGVAVEDGAVAVVVGTEDGAAGAEDGPVDRVLTVPHPGSNVSH